MAFKAVEMVRKIRDKHYEATKNLSAEEQIKIIKKKSEELQKRPKKRKCSAVVRTARTNGTAWGQVLAGCPRMYLHGGSATLLCPKIILTNPMV